MSVIAIIVAGGNSRRMGFDKLSANLNGMSVLQRTLEAFTKSPLITKIIIACSPACFTKLSEHYFTTPMSRVDAGKERQQSVQNALNSIPDDYKIVVIHDGARPLIETEKINECIEAAKLYGAATSGRPVTETVKRADAKGFVKSSIDRNDLWFMETPQAFRVNVLKRAYDHITERHISVTDEVSAVEALGVSAFIVKSEKPNIKITYPADLLLASKLLEQ
jgi:2-C-methyl-D-erythritol 4-phosphate cytidylyltransferase